MANDWRRCVGASGSSVCSWLGYSKSLKSNPSRGCKIFEQRSTHSRKIGSLWYNSRPIFTYCVPCPGNINTTGRSPCSCMPVRRRWGFRVSRVLTASSSSWHTRIRRWLNALRPTCNVYATSARSRSGCCFRYWTILSVAASSAELVLADNANNCQGLDFPDSSTSGASSTMTCALVPPIPKELTPALRGTPFAFHSASLVLT